MLRVDVAVWPLGMLARLLQGCERQWVRAVATKSAGGCCTVDLLAVLTAVLLALIRFTVDAPWIWDCGVWESLHVVLRGQGTSCNGLADWYDSRVPVWLFFVALDQHAP